MLSFGINVVAGSRCSGHLFFLLLIFTITSTSAQYFVDGDSVASVRLRSVSINKHDYYLGKLLDKVSTLIFYIEYDRSARKIETASYELNGDVIQRITVEYDAKGNKTRQVEWDKKNSPFRTQVWEYYLSHEILLHKTIFPDGTEMIHWPLPPGYHPPSGSVDQWPSYSSINYPPKVKHDNEGRVKERTNYDPQGRQDTRFVYAYDEAGRLIEIEIYDHKDEPEMRKVYRYDSDGRIYEVGIFNGLNEPKAFYKYTYEYF